MRLHRQILIFPVLLTVLAVLAITPAAMAAGASATGADILLSGSASSNSPQAGSAMSYTFHVKNSGPQSATTVVLTNRLHSSYVYRSATVNGIPGLCRGIPDVVGGVTLTCDVGTIAKGSQADVVVNVDAPASLGTYGVDASVASAEVDPNTNNNFVLINVQVKNSAVGAAPGVLSGPMYVRESFGNDLFANQTCWCRLDPAGLIVWTGGLSLNGIRAEYPNVRSEVWMTPDVHQLPSWSWANGGVDPAVIEPPGSLDNSGLGGVVVSNSIPSVESNNAALLPFVQPAGPVTVKASIWAGWYTTAIGFSSSSAMVSNFETSGLAWFVVRMPRTTPGGQGSTATWELHTNGIAGPSASGTMVLAGFNHLAISYDPAAGKVVASIEGVTVASVDYVVSGVQYVGFQGNGVLNDFRVQAGAIATP